MKHFSEALEKNTKTISSVAWCLNDISKALGRVGFRELAEELQEHSVDLIDAKNHLNTEYGALATRRLRETEQGTANVLKAALAGSFTAKERDNAED